MIHWAPAIDGGLQTRTEPITIRVIRYGDHLIAELDVTNLRIRRVVESGIPYGWEISLSGRDAETKDVTEVNFRPDDLNSLITALEAARDQDGRLVTDGEVFTVRPA